MSKTKKTINFLLWNIHFDVICMLMSLKWFRYMFSNWAYSELYIQKSLVNMAPNSCAIHTILLSHITRVVTSPSTFHKHRTKNRIRELWIKGMKLWMLSIDRFAIRGLVTISPTRLDVQGVRQGADSSLRILVYAKRERQMKLELPLQDRFFSFCSV